MTKPVSRSQSSVAKSNSQTGHKLVSSGSRRQQTAAPSAPRPLVVGQRYYVQSRHADKHIAEIIETRPMKRAGPPESSSSSATHELAPLEYYVHYVSFDRRLDEWVTSDRIDAVSAVSLSSKEPEGRHKKTGVGAELAESKESMAASLEKEHEEITRVKNIQFIELGQYEIETWYFSPYPGIYFLFY